MKILIKYCNNIDFIASFPKNFFDFCYIDPPYNTKISGNKSHIDSFEKSEGANFISETIMLSRKKMNYINFNFMSLGGSNFLLNCFLATKFFYSTDKTDLLLGKRSFVPTGTYLDNFEYLFYGSVRREKNH